MSETIVIGTEAAWHGARRKGLGASDAAAAAGLSKWKSNIRLWEEKTGRRAPEDLSGNPAVERGRKLEPLVRAVFEADHPELAVEYRGSFDLVRRDDLPWYLATLDGRLVERETGRKGVLEVKTSAIESAAAAAEWHGQVPVTYLAQVLHQLNATGWDFALLVAYIKDADARTRQTHSTRLFRFERTDYEDQMAWLLERERAFWRYVEEDREPPTILPA